MVEPSGLGSYCHKFQKHSKKDDGRPDEPLDNDGSLNGD